MSERHIDCLVKQTRSEDFLHRVHAAERLGQLIEKEPGLCARRPDVVDALVDAIPELFVGGKAIKALEKGGAHAIPGLRRALSHKEGPSREWCTLLLGRAGDKESLGMFVEGLADEDFMVMCKASGAIGRLLEGSESRMEFEDLCRVIDIEIKALWVRADDEMLIRLKRGERWLENVLVRAKKAIDKRFPASGVRRIPGKREERSGVGRLTRRIA